MATAARGQSVRLRSGDVVRLRQVRPDDAPALARAYANLGEQSRYRRFFTVMPDLPEATLTAAAGVDHRDHEALVALPLLSSEIAAIPAGAPGPAGGGGPRGDRGHSRSPPAADPGIRRVRAHSAVPSDHVAEDAAAPVPGPQPGRSGGGCRPRATG